MEINGFELNTVATDALVVKHKVISIQAADKIFIMLDSYVLNNIRKENYIL